MSSFMRANGLYFDAVDEDEKENLKHDLMTVGTGTWCRQVNTHQNNKHPLLHF